LYSHVDDALYLLGESYEGEIAMVRARPGNEAAKARLIEDFTKKAADAYSKILTRYPMMDRAEDAQKRLEALHRPIPKATPAAIAQNKAEEDSRRSASMLSHLTLGFKKHPDVSMATKVGEPTLVDPKVMGGHEVVTAATAALMAPAPGGSSNISVEVKNNAAPPPNQPTPRSDSAITDPSAAPPEAPDPNELRPNAPADSNELKPEAADSGQALPPPAQVNEIQSPGAEQAADKTSSSSSSNEPTGISSSKKKKKKGLHKIIPF